MRLAAALSCLVLLLSTAPCSGQTAQDISTLLKKSKLVDTGREVNARVGADELVISTYAHPKASNRDVKITALFMMKEIRQHYKNILHIRVLFYEPTDPKCYREVEIREGDVALVDQGKPVAEVLAQIGMTLHKRAAENTSMSASSGRSTLSSNPAGRSLVSTNDELAYTQSADGDVTMLGPKHWLMDNAGAGGYLLNFAVARGGSKITLQVVRYPLASGLSLDELADQHETEMVGTLQDCKRIARRSMSCAGVPAVYSVGSGHAPGQRVAEIERGVLLRKNGRLYSVLMYTAEVNDTGMDNLFQSVINSLRIR